MTQINAPTRNGRLEQHSDDVLQAYAKGESCYSIAKRYGVAPSTVTRLVERHGNVTERVNEEVVRQVEDYLIAHKVNRIAALDEDWRKLGEVMDARAQDEAHKDHPGWTTGRLVHQLKSVGSGDNAMIVSEYKVDTATINLRAELARKAAEELAQLPKPETNVNVDARQLIVRYVEGPQE